MWFLPLISQEYEESKRYRYYSFSRIFKSYGYPTLISNMMRLQIISFLSKHILFLILFVFLTYPKFPFLLRLSCHKRNVAWIAFGNVRSFSGNFYLSKSLNIGICLTQISWIYFNVFWHSFVKPNNDLAKIDTSYNQVCTKELNLNETLLRILNAWGETWFIL